MKANIQAAADDTFDITPMIDIVFLLITFFMVVAAQITQKVVIEMPEAQQAKVPDETLGRLEVTMDVTGQLYDGLEPISTDNLLAAIEEQRDIVNFHVYLRADAGVEHTEIKSIMKLLADNGILNITFGTLQQ